MGGWTKICFVLVSIFLPLLGSGANIAKDDISPFNQHLPDCTQPYNKVEVKTNAKIMLCPMIKDEQGFLSEWLAYYHVHGISHFTIMDDGSTDNGLDEVQPWIDQGMVTIVRNWTLDSLNVSHAFRRNEFKKVMTIKALLEANCKQEALKQGFDFYISLDLDEYLIPKEDGVSIADALHGWVNKTGRSVYCIVKNNFASSPHVLEPVNLLTIEAYQSRMPIPAKMNYYTSVANKCAYQLTGPQFETNTSQYIAECCHFHGCQGWDFRSDTRFCTENHKKQHWLLSGHRRPYYDTFIINHYSRSLEKYALKSKTWGTATGEVKAGESAEQAAKAYDIPKFLSRNVGWQLDRIALRYTCQVRAKLAEMTGEAIYLRPGTSWYRNPEFGKEVSDPDKRGRYGRPNAPGFKYATPNKYHYHGGMDASSRGKLTATKSTATASTTVNDTSTDVADHANTALRGSNHQHQQHHRKKRVGKQP